MRACLITVAVVALVLKGVVGAPLTQGTMVSLSANSQRQFTQTNQVQDFQLLDIDVTQYLYAFLQMDDTPQNRNLVMYNPPLFAANLVEKPTVIEQQGNSYVNATYFDTNGRNVGKLNLYISINPTMISQYCDGSSQCDFFVSFYVGIDRPQISYHVGIQQGTQAFCANDCSSLNNVCSADGICQCPTGLIDEDCSMPAQELIKDAQIAVTVNNQFLTYTYFEAPQGAQYLDDDLQLRVSKDDSLQVVLYVGVQGMYATSIPTIYSYTDRQALPSGDVIYMLPSSLLKYDDNTPRQIIFGLLIYSQTEGRCSLTIEKYQPMGIGTLDTKMLIVYVLIGIAGFLFIAWVVFTVVRMKCSEQEDEDEDFDGVGRAGGTNSARQRQRNQNRRARRGNRTLTQRTIDFFMPVITYTAAQANQTTRKYDNQPQCTVCLVEFEGKDEVRVSCCLHIFHRECIEQWLKKHENCPLCRNGLTKREMKEWYAKNRQPQQPDFQDSSDDDGERPVPPPAVAAQDVHQVPPQVFGNANMLYQLDISSSNRAGGRQNAEESAAPIANDAIIRGQDAIIRGPEGVQEGSPQRPMRRESTQVVQVRAQSGEPDRYQPVNPNTMFNEIERAL